MTRAATSEHLETGLSRLYLWLTTAVLVLGTPSSVLQPLAADESWPERFVSLWPVIACVAVIVALMRWQTSPTRVGVRWAVAVGAAIAVLVAVRYASRVANPVPGLTLTAVIVALGWYIAAVSVRRRAALFSGVPLLGILLVVLLLDVPTWAGGVQSLSFDDTLAYIFPRTPPIIGPGGRGKANLRMRISAPEYPWGARFITNSAGFRNIEDVREDRTPAEIRILSLGDSFATGMGADQAHFYGAYLAEELRRYYPDVQLTVLNAEVSDPSHGLYYLQEYGTKYRPHIVLYNMCGNDVMQAAHFATTGGLFALQDDGRIAINSAQVENANPWDVHSDFAYPAAGARAGGTSLPGLNFVRRTMANADQLAATKLLRRVFGYPKDGSYFSYAQKYEARDGRLRLIDGTYNLGFFYRHGDEVVRPMYDTFFEIVQRLDRVSREHGAQFKLVVFPQRYQAQREDWTALQRRWNLRDEDFDLERSNKVLAAFGRDYGIGVIDLLPAFRERANGGELFLPAGDVHTNRFGHDLAGHAAAAALRDAVDAARRERLDGDQRSAR